MNEYTNINSFERKMIINHINPNLKYRPALFLDRDGVLIEEKNYIKDPDDVKLCPGAKSLLDYANRKGWLIIVITNQSGIERGLFKWKDYELVTDRILELLGNPCPISAIYANGYGPNSLSQSWRKPSPGMLLAASKDLSVNLTRSILIGDRLSDMQAGARSKVKTLVHVLTGHGNNERIIVRKQINITGKFLEATNSSDIILLESLEDFPKELIHLF